MDVDERFVQMRRQDSFYGLCCAAVNIAVSGRSKSPLTVPLMERLVNQLRGGDAQSSLFPRLRELSKLFSMDFVFADLTEAEDPTRVLGGFILNHNGDWNPCTSARVWRIMNSDEQTTRLFVLMPRSSWYEMKEDPKRKVCFYMIFRSSLRLCWIRPLHLQKVLVYLGFFEPAGVVHLQQPPSEEQQPSDARIAVILAMCAVREDLTSHIDEVQEVYTALLSEGQYEVFYVPGDATFEIRMKCKTIVFETQERNVTVKGFSVAEMSVTLWQKYGVNWRSVLLTTPGKSRLLDGSTTNTSIAQDVAAVIARSAVIQSGPAGFAVRSRTGRIIAANSDRTVLISYLAFVYGKFWTDYIPSPLLPDTKAQMLARIMYDQDDFGVFCKVASIYNPASCELRMGPYAVADDAETLVEDLWRRLGDRWEYHVPCSQEMS